MNRREPPNGCPAAAPGCPGMKGLKWLRRGGAAPGAPGVWHMVSSEGAKKKKPQEPRFIVKVLQKRKSANTHLDVG